jgi:hypothetical protein
VLALVGGGEGMPAGASESLKRIPINRRLACGCMLYRHNHLTNPDLWIGSLGGPACFVAFTPFDPVPARAQPNISQDAQTAEHPFSIAPQYQLNLLW